MTAAGEPPVGEDGARRMPRCVVSGLGTVEDWVGHGGHEIGSEQEVPLRHRELLCRGFLDDITVSRRHAEVRRDGALYRVCDVGSLNGTYINRDRVDEQELHEGDELQVGKFKLVFVFGTGEI